MDFISPQVNNPNNLEDNPEMTSSYHEISVGVDSSRGGDGGGGAASGEADSSLTEMSLPVGAKRLLDRARHWVGDLSMDGVVAQEGSQVTYVAQDLSERIKTSRTAGSRNSSLEGVEECRGVVGGGTYLEDICTSDLNVVVNEMEIEAKKLASSVDTLTENLTGILHSLSSMTVDCVFTASDGVSQLCDTADASIKVMYQVMAKCEELNKAVQPIYQVNQQIKETKRLLDKVEAEMN